MATTSSAAYIWTLYILGGLGLTAITYKLPFLEKLSFSRRVECYLFIRELLIHNNTIYNVWTNFNLSASIIIINNTKNQLVIMETYI